MLSIKNALEILNRRHEAAQRFVDDQDKGEPLALELECHREEIGTQNRKATSTRS